MSATRTRAAGLLIVAALGLSLAGCGGFGSNEPETTVSPIKSYVALGDGFAAAPYVGRTTSKDGCLRSEGNYPELVAKALGVTSFTDVSCTGATTKAITDAFKPAGAKTAVPAQLDAITKDTDLVTITIGIENNHLLDNLFRLCAADPCGTKVQGVIVRDDLTEISADLPATIRAVTDRAPQAFIVVVGYPELLPTKENCKALPAESETEFAYSTSGWNLFSTAVGSAARQAGATYVDARRISAGHAPCSKQPWVNDYRTVPGKRIAFHPKAPEQGALAEAIAGQVRTR